MGKYKKGFRVTQKNVVRAKRQKKDGAERDYRVKR
jgi:hypothetical protein